MSRRLSQTCGAVGSSTSPVCKLGTGDVATPHNVSDRALWSTRFFREDRPLTAVWRGKILSMQRVRTTSLQIKSDPLWGCTLMKMKIGLLRRSDIGTKVRPQRGSALRLTNNAPCPLSEKQNTHFKKRASASERRGLRPSGPGGYGVKGRRPS